MKEHMKKMVKKVPFTCSDFLIFFLGKSILTFQKWTFLMSKNENLGYFPRKK